MGSFSLQEVKFFELILVILFCIFIIFIFSRFLEDVALPRVVTFIFTMERAIKQGVFLTAFLTVFLALLKLGTIFMSLGVTVLVSGRKLGYGDVFRGLGPSAVFYKNPTRAKLTAINNKNGCSRAEV